MYAFRNQETGEYPITPNDIREREKNRVSFGPTVTGTLAQTLGYDKVTIEAKPEFNENTQTCEANTPAVIDGVWTQTWTVSDMSEEELASALAIKKQEKLSSIEELRNHHLYTDVEVTFPNGLATIQFRDEADRTNLSNVAAGAMSHIIAGAPDAVMRYRTKDNVIHEVTAAQMTQIAGTVLQEKQSVVDTAWTHKDAVTELTNVLDILSYDITTGW